MGASLIDLAAARERVLAEATPVRAERIPLAAASGRVLAEDVAAGLDSPPFDASAMDGFAAAPGPEGELEVVGESRAGRPYAGTVGPGQAVRISTGAPVPSDADAVVPVERAAAAAGGEAVSASERVRLPERSAGDHVRRRGEDYRAGEVLLRHGLPLGPAEIGVLASLGRAEVACGGQPRVAVLVSGDELVEPGDPLAAGQVHDANGYSLAAQAERAGGRVVHRALVPDALAPTVEALSAALAAADVVCVSGGVSVGEHDHVKDALARLRVEERFWGVALKPGKPTWFGRRGGALVFGLPGNPVSAMVTFELFARPALARLAGAADPLPPVVLARLGAPVARHPSRTQAIRCRLEPGGDSLVATSTGPQGSHILTSMLEADGLLIVAAGEGEVSAEEPVEVELLR